jgi:predicted Zn finger-like uncharacterized protein
MIIACEKCQTKYNLDQANLKAGGSKVRCSKCSHVFTAFPPEQDYGEEPETLAVRPDEMESTISLDSSPLDQEELREPESNGGGMDFEDVFEESIEDLEKYEPVAPDDLKGLLGGDDEKPSAGPEKEDVPEKAGEETLKIEAELELPEIPQAPAPEKARRSPLLLIILFILLLVIAGALAVFFWAPGLIPDFLSSLKPADQKALMDAGVRRLKFPSVEGAFVESDSSGQLFVIQGTVRNNYPGTRSFVLLKGTILNEQGHPVKKQMAFAGNPLTENQIKTLPIEQIKKIMKSRFGTGRKNVNVPSGGVLPFTIVFEGLPKNLGEFTVEAVSSSPGK